MVTVTVTLQGLAEGTGFLDDIFKLVFDGDPAATRTDTEIHVASQAPGSSLFADADGSNLMTPNGVVSSIAVGRVVNPDFEISGLDLNAGAVYTAVTAPTALERLDDLATLFQGIGWDVDLSQSTMSNLVYGSQGNDTFTMGSGDDVIMLDGGNDVDDAGAGNDSIYAGNLTYFVADGQTSVTGGSGSDTFLLDYRPDGNVGAIDFFYKGQTLDLNSGKFVEKIGTHTLTVTFANIENASGTIGSDTLLGTNGDNTLAGGDGNDSIVGRGGDDTLFAGVGRDTLVGGAGADTLSGGGDGASRDAFLYLKASDSSAKAFDTITDFDHGEDKLDFRPLKLPDGAAFRLIGDHAFHHHAGEIQIVEHDAKGTAHDHTMLRADLDGDGKADMQIEFTGLVTLDKHDFDF
jgi:Ca2+-binding RTX toxin-like protein